MATSDIIKTERLIIKPFSEKYLTKKYVSWLNNPEVVRYSEQRHKKHTVKTCRAYLRLFEKGPNYFWAISVIKDKLGHIGNMTAYADEINSVADIGILIGETKAWGKGYATEAWMAVCSYLFTIKNIRKITAGTISSNKRMLKLMKRTGMINDGVRRKHYIWENNKVDVVHKAIFREDFRK
ncbi:MAG TPA: N-acetyltransferase [Candidatus Omnitrophica bacterium]|nr:N-acetyltransferase [Candidatus Omnitrophota bacterium]